MEIPQSRVGCVVAKIVKGKSESWWSCACEGSADQRLFGLFGLLWSVDTELYLPSFLVVVDRELSVIYS